MKQLYLGLKFSFSYFSLLPVKFSNSDNLSSKPVLTSMLFFFPLVGLVLGLLTLGVFDLLSSLAWLGAIISAVVYMILYGFLHTEAVIDVADAIYASHSGKDAYSIIKDPTVGAMGVLYAMGVILLKVSGISYLLLHGYFMEFMMVLIISRLSLLFLFYVHTFKSSFATQLKDSLTHNIMLSAFLLFGSVGVFLVDHFFTLLLLGLLFSLAISYAIKSRIKFVNGDVLGATLEGVEVLLFIVVALLWL